MSKFQSDIGHKFTKAHLKFITLWQHNGIKLKILFPQFMPLSLCQVHVSVLYLLFYFDSLSLACVMFCFALPIKSV